MRGTALVVLLCVFAAIAAHVLSEDARARSLAADEIGMPTECDRTSCCPSTDSDPVAPADDASKDAAATTDDATTKP